MSKCSTNTIRNQWSTGDGHVVQANHTTTVFGGGNLCNVHRDNHGGAADTKTNDKSTHCHLSKSKLCSLKDSADDEESVSNVDFRLAAKFVGSGSSEDGAEEGSSRSDGSNQFFLV